MADKVEKITAYDMKAKKKGVEMLNAVIDKKGNRYFAKGKSADGNSMCVTMGQEKAEAAIKNKVAKKGEGW